MAGAKLDADDLTRRTAAIFADAITLNTRRTYARRWRAFEQWAGENGYESLPATPETVVLYLGALALGETSAAMSTLRGRVAAIDRVHLEAGQPPPGTDPQVRLLLRGLLRQIGPGARANPVGALRVGDLRAIVQAIPTHDARMVRDRAMVGLRIAGISDRGIAHLRWSETRFSARSATVVDHQDRHTAARVRLDDQGAVATLSALWEWRRIAGTSPDCAFIGTDEYGGRYRSMLSAADVARVIDMRHARHRDDADPENVAVTFARLGMANPLAVRDRALILIGWAGAFRCMDLVMLRWADVREATEGVIIRLRYSKTDRTGRGTNVGIPLGKAPATCPVAALSAWRSLMASCTTHRGW